MIKGTLIPIGGNENKGEETDENISFEFIKKGILSHVVRESGGPDSKIIVIPTASSVPEEVAKNYLDAFGILGCTDIEILDIRSREDSESSRAVDLIKAADCVMFSGGDQSKITKKIEGTTIHQIMMERYQNDESFVIAGTSAGAMAMSSHMIAGGSSTEAFIKGAVIMYHGLGLMPEIMIDTHFIMRGRFGRICEAVAKYPTLVGFGLAEDTGLVIKNGN
ncbi:MAG: cyanophycinase, partial [Bacteroidia bacterium]